MADSIEVAGARTNNLKNISCEFPHGKLTVVTGVSGSGKSSLAFDTLYAEGQRRYVESLSTYARQFLEKMKRPDVDWIHNIQPAIAIEQKNPVKNARSTVGTSTEIHDYLRLLFAKIGVTFCPECGLEVRRESPEHAADSLIRDSPDGRFTLVAPARVKKKTAFASAVREMIAAGFSRVWTREGLKDLTDVAPADRDGDHALWIVIDRLVAREEDRSRMASSMELAFQTGSGEAAAIDAEGKWRRFHRDFVCPNCNRQFRKPEPQLFSFMSPLGACPECQGYGRVIGVDLGKVIPSRELTLNDRPIAAWNTPSNLEMYDYMLKNTAKSELPRDVPLKDLDPEQWKTLLEGNGEFTGVYGFFRWLETKKYKIQARVFLAKYRDYTNCPACGGSRLQPEALCVKVAGENIAAWTSRSVSDLKAHVDGLALDKTQAETAERIVEELRSRLRYLVDVGLGYLTLARQTRTLSGGESQRINLAAALGSGLTNTLYVLDEPTVGLHPRDTDRLMTVIKALRDNDNTLAVVEHDPDVIAQADHIIDLGPAAGEWGGEIVYQGAAAGFAKNGGKSKTAAHQKRRGTQKISSRRRKATGAIHIRGARCHNLKNVDVELPLGILGFVTGVSGSGKTSLMHDILYGGFQRERMLAAVDVGEFDRIEGWGPIDEIILVDQNLPGRSSRSNPATYVKAWDAIRDLLASTREARAAGLTTRDFSFNVEGGRCERCEGAGVEVIDMHFLADVEVVCSDCDGKRFQRKVLMLEFKGKNVDEILSMTVSQALEFFADQKKVARALKPLADVGLGYLRLGQSAATLSGGEAQRLKLASYLGASSVEGKLFLFDEPTIGLHTSDIETLADVLQRLVDSGASVWVIEHNLDLIAHADWIVDMGPEGGDGGGRVVAQGAVEAIIGNKDSKTGEWLGKRFVGGAKNNKN